MKRKRARKTGGKKTAPPAAAEEPASPEPPSSPSTEPANSPADQAEDEVPAVTAAAPAAPEPPPPPPPPTQPPQKPSSAMAAPINPADITYTKPKVGAVYGRVKLKFKSSTKAVEPTPPPQQQQQQQQSSSSEAKAPAADTGKSGNAAAVPEPIDEVAVDAKKAVAVTDGQQTEGQASELSSSEKEKVVRKVGGIKIKSAAVSSSVENSTPDRKADSEDEPHPSKRENKEIEDIAEPKSSQDSEEKQSTPERQRDDKELAAALEAIKKTMKMDAAEPFNVPVDPVALGIPDYFDIIDTPMDFGTVCQNLEQGNKYMNSEDVYKDVQLIWDNCTKYNSKGDYIVELMKRVKKSFMKNWLAASLYSDMPESGGNDNTGDEGANGPKSKSKNKRRRPGNDRHKNDCVCAVCQVTRRKKEKDEILAVADNETTVMNSNTSDQHSLEGNSGANNPGSHDTSSQEQPLQTYMYKEAADGNDTDIQMEDESSRQYSDEKEGIGLRVMNSQGEHTPSQPNDYSGVEQHQQKTQMESSSPEIEMEDYPAQQENPSFMQLCASLFPSNKSSTLRGRHSLFRQQRRVPLKEGPLHAAMAAIMKQ